MPYVVYRWTWIWRTTVRQICAELCIWRTICWVPVLCISSIRHMYTTDFAYDGPIFLVPLSLSYPSSPVLLSLSLLTHNAVSFIRTKANWCLLALSIRLLLWTYMPSALLINFIGDHLSLKVKTVKDVQFYDTKLANTHLWPDPIIYTTSSYRASTLIPNVLIVNLVDTQLIDILKPIWAIIASVCFVHSGAKIMSFKIKSCHTIKKKKNSIGRRKLFQL